VLVLVQALWYGNDLGSLVAVGVAWHGELFHYLPSTF